MLSVVSAQLQTIQIARKLGKERFEFSGKEIRLNMRCGVFITMNPGYAGAFTHSPYDSVLFPS